jgi:beta-glucosidase-like glycosyl hydrolase
VRTDPLERVMLAFRGTTVPAWLPERLAEAPAAGFTLFRAGNVRSPEQVRRLNSALQAAARARKGAASEPPLLIATDQEGGQLLALGNGFTPFAGPMAIGATSDAGLAERVGRAIGTELRAVATIRRPWRDWALPGCAGSSRPAWPRPASIFRAWAASSPTPTTSSG